MGSEARSEKIIRFYNVVSGIYDLLSSYEWEVVESGLKLLGLDRNDCILDIGCGTGRAVRQLSSRCKIVFGLDLAENMLSVAEKKLGGRANASLCLADAAHLPFRDESFDVATAIFTLEILGRDELMRALSEILRVLRKGGKFLAISIHDKPCKAIKVYKLMNKLFPTIVNCKPIKLTELLKEAGFRVIQVREKSLYGLPVMITVASKP